MTALSTLSPAPRRTDLLLRLGKALSLFIQGACALLGGLVVLLVPFVALAGMGALDGLFEPGELPIVATYPGPGVGLLVSLALIAAAMFLFFGRMRALIGSVGDGDPFIPENAQRLSVMAWLLLAAQVLAVPVAILRERMAALALDVAPDAAPFAFGRQDLVGIVLVVVLFILARVFRHGAAMREDLEGTV